MTTSASSWHNMDYAAGPAGQGAVAPTITAAAARGPFGGDNDEEKDPLLFSESFLVSPPPALSRSSFGYGNSSNSSSNHRSSSSHHGAGSLLLPAFVPFVGTTRHKNKHRSCGCPVPADGSVTTSQCRCWMHPTSYAASCPSLIAVVASSSASSSADRRPSATDSNSSNSLAASFDDLEQRIKRVRLSSTPGELCWARELRDLCSHQGWRTPAPHAHNAGAASHRSGVSSSSGEPSWYDKVLEEVVAGTAAHGQDRAACRMVLEPLAPHRLALHLQYRRVLLHGRVGEDDDGMEDLFGRSNVLPEIRVDVRIPRHYPHEPPVVSGVRYHHHHHYAHRNDSEGDEAMEMHYPRRATSDSWPPSLLRRHSLCQVDSIVLVPFDPEGDRGDPEELLLPCDNDGADEDQQQDDEPSKREGDLNDQPMVTTSSADAETADQGRTIGHGPSTPLWNPDCRREMKVHGYSPVHRLSDVLERIAVALWCATTRNTTLVVVPTHGGASDINDDMDMSTGATRNGGLNRQSGCSSSGAALHGSATSPFPTRSSAPASDASWLSSGVTVAAAGAWAASAGTEEADQATERHL